MDYNKTFTNRAKSYTYAVKTYPEALKEEFETAVRMCGPFLKDNRLLNIPAACIDIESFLPSEVEYFPFETNPEFASLNGVSVCKFDEIPLEKESISHILCLASLHHATQDERAAFYREAWRILQQDGKLIIGDVDSGSPQDPWLNEFVNRYNSLGHRGMFWKKEDSKLLEQTGFTVKTSVQEYSWNFKGSSEKMDFVRNLFGLDMATDDEIVNGLEKYLKSSGADPIPWRLRYFIASKPT